jgi:hypothetical protein
MYAAAHSDGFICAHGPGLQPMRIQVVRTLFQSRSGSQQVQPMEVLAAQGLCDTL